MDAGHSQQHRDGAHRDRTPAAPPRSRWGTGSINLAARQPVSHAIMFYLLSLAALVIFAPCVLVPIWRDVQRLGEDERAMARIVADYRQQIERNNVRIEALQADPQVIERVARRELNQQPAGEQHISWTPAELAALRLNIPHNLDLDLDPDPVPASTTPAWVEKCGRWLPAWAASDLFAKSPNRELLLSMAGALLLTAFVLYTPKAESRIRDEAEEAAG
jgi:hypothetical protein